MGRKTKLRLVPFSVLRQSLYRRQYVGCALDTTTRSWEHDNALWGSIKNKTLDQLRKYQEGTSSVQPVSFFFFNGGIFLSGPRPPPPLSRLHDHTSYEFSGRVISPTQRPLPDNTQHSQETDIHATSDIRTRNPSKRVAADPNLRRRGHWDRQLAVKFDLFCSQKRILCWWLRLLPSCPGQGRLQIGHIILPVLIARQRCQHGQHNFPLLL